MSNLLLQKIVLLWVTEVGKIILKKKRPLLLARSVYMATVNQSDKYLLLPLAHPCKNITYQMTFLYNWM